MLIGLLASCSEPKSASIYGNWVSPYGDGYTISETTIVYDDGCYGFGYTGNIEKFTSDYIYYSLENKTKFCAVSYKNVTETSCELSGAYKDPKAGGKTHCNTLEEAKKEFTVNNDYYGVYGEYVRK